MRLYDNIYLFCLIQLCNIYFCRYYATATAAIHVSLNKSSDVSFCTFVHLHNFV